MNSLLNRLSDDLNKSLKDKDDVSVSVLRMVLSNLKNAQIAKGSELSDDEVLSEISKDAKRHKESIKAFEEAGRTDLAEKEKAELKILLTYLPEELSEDELSNMVSEAIGAVGATSISDMGKVVKAVLSSAGARADGATVAELARKKLSGS